MPAPDTQNRDLTLPPDTYLFLQNEAKGGVISVYRGPALVNQTGQDKPVRYDAGSRRYQQCGLEQAVQQFPRAAEGDYVVLENPTEDGQFPRETNNPSKPLKKGRKVILPGPWSEALYPGQSAQVIEGHRLRSNQYLVAIIYNADEAEKNWETGTVAKAQTEGSDPSKIENDPSKTPEKAKAQAQPDQKPKGLPKPDSFAVGTRIVIRGSDVSFYIPCTGVEVLKEDNNYVREAVTLEQLEYCILIDESGKKEHPRGPAVVFPKPTQVFQKDSKSRRKFKPLELNKINGVHLKVTANFKGPDIEFDTSTEREFKEGEELFVSGNTLSIYYPREELSVIEYGAGNKKHYSTAIPKGEGRYVINRTSGDIRLLRGPSMFLADPRTDIPVRRVLSEFECRLCYPDNEEALAYNLDLAAAMAESPSGRSGAISEGDYRKRQMKARGLEGSKHYLAAGSSGAEAVAADYGSYEPEDVSDEDGSSSITRGNKFTPPRTLTLNTKYDGVPKIEIWPGYAVLVVGAEGSRRVVTGPQTILLEYDEKLGFMYLSTGKPKSTDKRIRTAYLCIQNNQVGDIVSFESKDHVKGKIKISLRVNFEGETEDDQLKWFGTDNYVKYLTDHVRSIIAGMAKRKTVAEVKGDYVNLVRDSILGTKTDAAKRPGLSFDNGMRVIEVEVLELTLDDPSIAQMLDKAQTDVVKTNIEIDNARRDLAATTEKERITQQKAIVTFDTKKQALKIEQEMVTARLQLALEQFSSDLTTAGEALKKQQVAETMLNVIQEAQLARDKASNEQDLAHANAQQVTQIELLQAETTAATERMAAAKDGLCEALVAMGRDDMAAKLAQAVNLERHLTGESLGSSLGNLLSFFPSLQQFMERGQKIQENGNGTNRLTTKPVGAQ